MKTKIASIAESVLEKADFQGVYTRARLTPTRCELMDRANPFWWATENTTCTERNAIKKKIICHINELIHLLSQLERYDGIYSGEEDE